MYDLKGKTAFITGTTSGLGARFARVLAKAGASVALTGRRVERLDALKAEIAGEGGRVASFALDVTDPASIEAALDGAEAALGPIDILVNNAGVNLHKRVEAYAPEDYDFVMDTNAKGAFFCATGVARRLIQAKRPGSIINVASIGAHTPLPGLTAYCMSKAAVAMMTQSMARDWARHLINVNAICPGYIVTEINDSWFETDKGKAQVASFPRRRLGAAEDLDGVLLLLASDASRFITGSIITVDDGQSLAKMA